MILSMNPTITLPRVAPGAFSASIMAKLSAMVGTRFSATMYRVLTKTAWLEFGSNRWARFGRQRQQHRIGELRRR
ncbi:MAG TPA: hypothetical protein VFG03_20375 [Telluria sp.]|nr:hypothetical protein [Telluria sp.]